MAETTHDTPSIQDAPAVSADPLAGIPELMAYSLHCKVDVLILNAESEGGIVVYMLPVNGKAARSFHMEAPRCPLVRE